MARTQNEIDRDTSIVNLLSAILGELKTLNSAHTSSTKTSTKSLYYQTKIFLQIFKTILFTQ